MSSLANHWAAAGREVSIVTLGPASADVYRVDPRVRRIALSLTTESRSLAEAMWMNLRRTAALRHAIRSLRPDVTISFNAQLNVLALLACLGLRIPVIVSERIHPPSYDVGATWALLRWITYRFADGVVVQSEAIRRWARAVARAERIHVIPNAVGPPFASAADPRDHRSTLVLGVGRLVPQKGFDLLIRAFGSIVRRHLDWSLTIVGDGPEEPALKRLAVECLPAGAASFPGSVPDPERYYRAAGLFVLPSRFEGFPNALLEAMASGCAVIATDCPTGPSEIVRQGVDGILVPPQDAEALAREMDRLIGDAAERNRLGACAREVASRFRRDRIAALWDDVIGRVLG